jgi:hypothetical protein
MCLMSGRGVGEFGSGRHSYGVAHIYMATGVVALTDPLHCRIVRHTTRRARGLLCHWPVRAACEVFVLLRQRARVGCCRGLLWDRPVAPARRCFVRRRFRGRRPGPAPFSACRNPQCLSLLLLF